jgi:hypothetical protein
MGRPRKYETNAERQRAYRQRYAMEVVPVDRHAWEQLHLRLDHLHQAIAAAKEAGDPTARACSAMMPELILEKLIVHFRACAKERGRLPEEGAR